MSKEIALSSQEVGVVLNEKIAKLKEENNYSKLELSNLLSGVKKDYWSNLKCTCYEDVVKYKTPDFQLIEKYFGTNYAIKIIMVIVSEYLEMFSSIDLSDAEIQMLGYHILTPYDRETKKGGYPGLSIQDLRLCMFMGIKGQFGKAYGSYKLHDITGSGGWIDQYAEFKQAKIKAIEERSREERARPLISKDLLTSKGIPVPERIIKAREDLEKQILMKKIEKPEKPAYFSTINQYCRYKGYDYVRFMDIFSFIWDKDAESSSMDYELYIRARKQMLLFKINEKWKKSS